MKKLLSAALAAVLSISAFGSVASAAAATEFGSGCAADSFAPFQSLVSVAHGPTSPLPVAAPSAGVITEWKLNAELTELTPEERAELANAVAQQLLVLRPAGPDHYSVVGRSEAGALDLGGVSSHPASIPVQQGDLLGLSGAFTLFCETTDPGDAVAPFFGSSPVGATVETEAPVAEAQVPVVATIEPDVDDDGAGDQTQDKCPQSPAYQAPCPVVTINSKPIAGKRAVTVYVTTSLAAPVAVTGTAYLGKGRTATLGAASQTVSPGSLAPFTLPLTGPVTKVLKKLSPKKWLRVSVTASATNVAGSPSTTASTVWLKGQARPRPTRHQRHRVHRHKRKRQKR
jgi:hypothetical protein